MFDEKASVGFQEVLGSRIVEPRALRCNIDLPIFEFDFLHHSRGSNHKCTL